MPACPQTARARSLVLAWFGFAVAVVGIFVTLSGGVVSAGTTLESTAPEDQSTVAGPLTEIRITFTDPTTKSDEGFEVLRSDGTAMEPIRIDADGAGYVLIFNPGLGSGTYGVRWAVMSADGDSLTGAFQFSVEVPPTTVASSTVPATTDPNATTDPDATTPSTSSPTTAASTTVPASSVPGSSLPGGSAPASSTVAPSSAPTTSPEFAELLASGRETGQIIPRLGHILRFGGTIFAIGGLVALIAVVQSDKHDLFVVLNTVRMTGIVIVLGAALEWAAFQEVAGGGLGSLARTRTGVATLFCWVGGVLMLIGLTERRSLEPVGESFRWRPGLSSIAGLIGAGAVLVSFGFDGHTSARGPQLLLAVVEVTHVAVAAVWAGGVAVLAMVAWMRRRRGHRARLSHAVVRFSPIAAASLAVVAITGVAMAALIVADPGSPVDSVWGRTLVVKVVLVVMAVAAGGFNRFALVPRLKDDPDSLDTAQRVRLALTVEASIFAAVTVVTAFLVTLSTATG